MEFGTRLMNGYQEILLSAARDPERPVLLLPCLVTCALCACTLFCNLSITCVPRSNPATCRCQRHPRRGPHVGCAIRSGRRARLRVHVAGVTCVDHSTFGSKQGAIGSSNKALAIWIFHRTIELEAWGAGCMHCICVLPASQPGNPCICFHLTTFSYCCSLCVCDVPCFGNHCLVQDIIINECTPHFNPEAVKAHLPTSYAMYTMLLSPRQFGVPASRLRRYTFFINTDTVTVTTDLWEAMQRMMRTTELDGNVFLRHTPPELAGIPPILCYVCVCGRVSLLSWYSGVLVRACLHML